MITKKRKISKVNFTKYKGYKGTTVNVQAWKCSKNNCNFRAYEYTQSTSCPEHGYYFMVKI